MTPSSAPTHGEPPAPTVRVAAERPPVIILITTEGGAVRGPVFGSLSFTISPTAASVNMTRAIIVPMNER